MNSWGKRAATGTFAALTFAVVVGGGFVLAGAFLCIWILNAYPPDTAYPVAIAACLVPAAAAAVASMFLFRRHPADAPASTRPLLDVLTAAGHAGRPMGGLIIASFLTGLVMGARSAGHPPSPHS